jgi:hypothetical protein
MYRNVDDPLDVEIAGAEAAVRRGSEIRMELVRLRRRGLRLFPVSRRFRIHRLESELRALGDAEAELERLYLAKERALAGSPLGDDAAALRLAVEELQRIPPEDATIGELIDRARRLRALQQQRSRLLGAS